jgi:hypothetical protein
MGKKEEDEWGGTVVRAEAIELLEEVERTGGIL